MDDAIVRRSCRLLNAVLQLHKEGYQNLAIFPGESPSGMHWRCELHPYSNLAIENGRAIVIDHKHDDREDAHHSSGQTGHEYFGWTDCKTSSARELAKVIAERFPVLLEKSRGRNQEYSGWLVSAVGLAESGHLPIHYSDCGTENNSDRPGSFAYNTPPLQIVREIGGIRSVFTSPPHLIGENDWHTAYTQIISEWRESSIRRLPSYPIETQDIFELGAYWEGAIWYINQVLGVKTIESYLENLDSYSPTSERWQTFFAVWDSQGQLDYLNAFLIRHMLSGSYDCQCNRDDVAKYKDYLQKFESKYRSIGETFPNPYFGGNNPLHLGLILSGLESNNLLLNI